VPPAQAGLAQGARTLHTDDEFSVAIQDIVGARLRLRLSREHAPIALTPPDQGTVVAEFYLPHFLPQPVNGGTIPFGMQATALRSRLHARNSRSRSPARTLQNDGGTKERGPSAPSGEVAPTGSGLGCSLTRKKVGC